MKTPLLHFDQINDPTATPSERLRSAQYLLRSMQPDLHTVCEVDLHLHSFYSDGYHSPTGRVFEAWRRGIATIALTDHDTFDGCIEALDAGALLGIDVLPGIEFYTDRPGIEIIAYWPLIDHFRAFWHSGLWKDVVEPIRIAKQKQLTAMMARVPACMEKHDFTAIITESDIHTYVRNGVSTKGDISVILWQKYGPALAEQHLSTDVKDFHVRYTTPNDELNVELSLDMDLSPAAFVKRIRAWGGLPGIAHPTELRKKEGMGNAALESIMDDLGACGLQTFEVDGWRNTICPETGRPHTDVFLDMMHVYNARHPHRLPLLPTNGSDDHNQPGEGLAMGCGKNNNLRPACGTRAHLAALRQRAEFLSIE